MEGNDKTEVQYHDNGLYSVTKMNGVDLPPGTVVGFGEFPHDRWPPSKEAIDAVKGMYRNAEEMRERALKQREERRAAGKSEDPWDDDESEVETPPQECKKYSWISRIWSRIWSRS